MKNAPKKSNNNRYIDNTAGNLLLILFIILAFVVISNIGDSIFGFLSAVGAFISFGFWAVVIIIAVLSLIRFIFKIVG